MPRLPILLPLLLVLAGAPAGQAAARDYRYADAHVHYVDYFQDTEGIDALFAAMDEAGVEHVALMGMPVTKKWHEDAPKRPRYYQGDDAPLYWYSATDAIVAEAVRGLPPARRARVHPFLTGFNPNDKNATEHIERMLALYPGVFEGIGEAFTRHDDLSALIQGEAPRANNEAMMRIYRLAAQHDLPVLVHSNLTSAREREPIYLDELREALEDNPDTRFIWAHAGTSAGLHRAQGRLRNLPGTLAKLLREHDNLWIDLSWSVLDPYILDGDGTPSAGWLTLIQAHPDRFLIGSDALGRFDELGAKLAEFGPLLDALPAPVARKLAHDNLLTVLPGARFRTVRGSRRRASTFGLDPCSSPRTVQPRASTFGLDPCSSPRTVRPRASTFGLDPCSSPRTVRPSYSHSIVAGGLPLMS